MFSDAAAAIVDDMIEIRELTKRYGDKTVIDHLSFEVHSGQVTGFLGPNGAGKSTTMRTVLGLDAPTSGEALVNGRRYSSFRLPLFEVGALLDANAVHPGRSAYAHLYALALSNGISRRRVVEVLDQVGLADVARKRVGRFSLGMKQRLGIAAALLGDPGVLLLDEPVNGLDPEGIRWIRDFMKSLAAEDRTVLVSSHLMSEMALTADRVVIIGRGKLIRDSSMAELNASFTRGLQVRTGNATELARLLLQEGASVTTVSEDELQVAGVSTETVGDLAAQNGVSIYSLTSLSASLEDAYLEMTNTSVEYRARAKGGARQPQGVS